MTPSLEELLDIGEAHTRRILLTDKEKELQPFYHLVVPGDQPDIIVPVSFGSVEDKENTVAIISAMAAVYNACGVLFVSESWMAIVAADEDDPDRMTPPSQRPDRIEIVAIIASDGQETKSRALSMIRNKKGQLIRLDRRAYDSDHVGGRMIDGIIPTSVTRH